MDKKTILKNIAASRRGIAAAEGAPRQGGW